MQAEPRLSLDVACAYDYVRFDAHFLRSDAQGFGVGDRCRWMCSRMTRRCGEDLSRRSRKPTVATLDGFGPARFFPEGIAGS